MLCKHKTLIFSITCAYSIITKIRIKCSQLCKQFSWLISLYKAAEGAHTLFLVCHTQKNDKLHVHTHVHARVCGWHGPTHVCAQAASSGMSCTATVAVPALVTHTNRSRCVQQKSWEWAPHGQSTHPSGHSFWTCVAWSHQAETPTCASGVFSELPECFFQMDFTQEEVSWCILTLILDANQSSAGGDDLEAPSTAHTWSRESHQHQSFVRNF